jgi:hypothetical protein
MRTPKYTRVESAHENIDQVLISITEDKLENILIKNRIRYSWPDEIMSSFGLVLAIGTTLVSSDFKDALYLTKSEWKSIFILLLVISLIYLVIKVVSVIRMKSVDEIIKLTKNIRN